MAHPPTLPAEVAYSDVELDLIDIEPPGLLPTDQVSYWGQLRKVLADYTQANAVDLFTQWYNNLDPRVVDANDIAEWEYMLDVPNGTALSLAARRNRILSRLYKGAFTRTIRNQIIESYIAATFGAAVSFDPFGVAIDSSGIPLFSGASSLVGSYRVYEDIRGYSFAVWIRSDITPDINGLTRDLARISPYNFTIDNTQADVLRYFELVRNAQPIGHWRLGSLADASGNGYNLTANGGVVAGSLAQPGLLVNPSAGTEGGAVFDGVNDYFTAVMAAGPAITKTLEGWVKLTAAPGTGVTAIIVSTGSLEYLGVQGTTGANLGWSFTCNIDGVQYYVATAPGTLALNTTYHVVGTFDGQTMLFYVNGVIVNSAVVPGKLNVVNANNVFIGQYAGGGSNFLTGQSDEVAIYNYALAPGVVLDHYNTGRDVATY